MFRNRSCRHRRITTERAIRHIKIVNRTRTRADQAKQSMFCIYTINRMPTAIEIAYKIFFSIAIFPSFITKLGCIGSKNNIIFQISLDTLFACIRCSYRIQEANQFFRGCDFIKFLTILGHNFRHLRRAIPRRKRNLSQNSNSQGYRSIKLLVHKHSCQITYKL